MFSPKSFSPVSFSITSFKMAQEESARSGYWRLFYYNLQEEELAKREQKQGKEEKARKSTGKKTKSVEPVHSITEPSKSEETEPPVKIRPLYKKPSIISLPDYSELIHVFNLEYLVSIQHLEILHLALLAKEAENEEEEDIELLLLAA